MVVVVTTAMMTLRRRMIRMMRRRMEGAIPRALEVVYETQMKAKDHVELAMAFIPRLEGLLQKLTDKGVGEAAALEKVQQTYSRTNGVMISAEDHLQAVLAA